jgi:hypothetical protein
MTSTRSFVVTLFVAGTAMALAGCDDWNDRGSLPLTAVEPAPVNTITPTSGADAGTLAEPPASGDTGAPAITPSSGSYETMCRNYCGALEQTLVYACIGGAQYDAATCGARFAGTETQCWEIRCVPKLVEPGLCPTQCDSLAAAYASACGANGTSPAGALFVCETPPAVHDAACRAGCAVDPTLAP